MKEPATPPASPVKCVMVDRPGPEETFEPVLLTELLRSVVDSHGERPFIFDGERTVTYAEFWDTALHVARCLRTAGVEPGDRVALWLSNRLEWIVSQFAVTFAGGVLVALNTRLRAEDLAHALDDCGAKLLITQARSGGHDFAGLLAGILDRTQLRTVVLVDAEGTALPAGHLTWEALVAEPGDQYDIPQTALDDIAYLLYTSGTTSRPKGVMLTHRSLNNSRNVARRLRDGEVTFVGFPLFALTGCQNAVLAAVACGGAVIVRESFDGAAALRDIQRHGATHYAGPAPLVEALAEALPQGAPPVLESASVMPYSVQQAPTWKRLGLRWVATGYGMTESGGPATIAEIEVGQQAHSNGRPFPGNRVRIVDESGQVLGPDQVGHVLLYTPHRMLGYWRQPEATAGVLHQDGWLRTGDIGTMSSAGDFTWVGRDKDVYKSSGFIVASQEVESFLSQHPDVDQVAVVPMPDPLKGEVGWAFVVLAPGVDEVPDLRAFCRQRIASYKTPARVVTVESLPLTATGKVRKTELRERFHEVAR